VCCRQAIFSTNRRSHQKTLEPALGLAQEPPQELVQVVVALWVSPLAQARQEAPL
jgi:hypothetical protein